MVEGPQPRTRDDDEPGGHPGVRDRLREVEEVPVHPEVDQHAARALDEHVVVLGGGQHGVALRGEPRELDPLEAGRGVGGQGLPEPDALVAGDVTREAAHVVEISGLVRRDAGLRRLDDVRRPPGLTQRHRQRGGDHGLADPGVGAGDDEDVVHPSRPSTTAVA